jgi:NADH:ubiquinone oxidoreductase subunit 3 (subunit A)
VVVVVVVVVVVAVIVVVVVVRERINRRNLKTKKMAMYGRRGKNIKRKGRIK